MLYLKRIALSLVKAYALGSGFASDVPGGAMAFLKSDPALACPDMQMILTTAPLPAWPYFPLLRKPFADGFACRTVLLHPKSRGEIKLAASSLLLKSLIHHDLCTPELQPQCAFDSKCEPDSTNNLITCLHSKLFSEWGISIKYVAIFLNLFL